MNYNDKDQELDMKKDNHMDDLNLKMDDMNIKSHLNASLDLSGIHVSEDLINRTLQAIRQQETMDHEEQTTSKEEVKKIVPWSRYVRRIAGVAAAVFVVVIGLNALTRLNFGSKSSESNFESASDSRMTNDMAEKSTEEAALDDVKVGIASVQEEEVTMDAASTESTAEAPVAAEDNQYTVSAEATLQEDGSDGSSEESNKEATNDSDRVFAKGDADTNSSLYNSNGGVSDALSFRDIFLADSEQAEQITIFGEQGTELVTLTDRNDIENFYVLMDQQQFQAASDVVVEPEYTIEINTKGEVLNVYTMSIGNGVAVQTQLGDTVSQSDYQSVDEEWLILCLQEFILGYQQ